MRIRVVLSVFVTLVVLAGAGIFLAVHFLGNGLPFQLTPQRCVITSNGHVTLKPEQAAMAATIAAVGIRRGLPERAVVVALATALQESKLYNLSGGDRDSVGLFQQRPSQGWGTVAQISDPRYAAGAFYTALLKVRGWQHMRVADAAQAVQRSADGGAYQKWTDEAQILAAALTGATANAVTCTITDKPARRGDAAADALAAGLAADWGQVDTVPADDLLGLALAVDGTRTGWQFAHWLVAHSADENVKSVRFDGKVWTAHNGTWVQATGDRDTAGGNRVIAEVYEE